MIVLSSVTAAALVTTEKVTFVFTLAYMAMTSKQLTDQQDSWYNVCVMYRYWLFGLGLTTFIVDISFSFLSHRALIIALPSASFD
jgi:hypothetical protein